MGNDLNIEEFLEQSELVRQVRLLRERPGPSRLFGDRVKPLNADQIARMTAQGCESLDWSQIHVTDAFDARAVSRVRFDGTCILGRFAAARELAPGVPSPSGIRDATLINCEVGDDALVRDVGLLANYVIGESAIISSVGEMIASTRPTFGNGTEIALGVETGERAVRAVAELDLLLADALVRAPTDSDLRRAYDELLRHYLDAIGLRKGHIGPHTVMRGCQRIHDVFVGEGALIEGAAAIVNATILSGRDEQTRIGDAVQIYNSLIQWGCEVTSGALVENSLLTEHSHVERHGKVTHSLLGPNTGVGEGEVTSALVGPFVGFHHQALLIAALWPEGKGNVGYGANVGSNHTSKAADQELWPAEGMFFGLGVNIKFPSNFERAPYTIIATGVTTLPQKVEFPFSLINAPSRVYEGVSPAFNEIIPGWVLSDNAYALARNEAKFGDRNRARRTPLVFEVLRPQTIDTIKEARRRLLDAPQKTPSGPGEPVLYFERDIAGLGKNYMLEANRTRAIETYSFYLRFYALRGLYGRLLLQMETAEGKIGDLEKILDQPAETLRWAHELQTLKEQLPDQSVRELLALWLEHHSRHVEGIRISKARDDERGARIIPDYDSVHTPVADDKVVRAIAQEHKQIEKRVQAWLEG